MRGFVAGVLTVIVGALLWWGVPVGTRWVKALNIISAQVGQVTDQDGKAQPIVVADLAALLAQERMAQLEQQQKQKQQQAPTPDVPPASQPK